MFVNKSAQEPYQLFSGIYENKLFLQILGRKGEMKYSFESATLDTSSERALCADIMEASYTFFDPQKFTFAEDFVLANDEPFLVRRYGEKVMLEEQRIITCQSFGELPAFETSLFIESFLPFEQPVQAPIRTNIEELIRNSPKWLTSGSILSGIAE